jgi:hypothetical protein
MVRPLSKLMKCSPRYTISFNIIWLSMHDLHHLYVATFQHHLHMEYIYLSWYIILAVYVYLYYTVYKAIQDVIIVLYTHHIPLTTLNYIIICKNSPNTIIYSICRWCWNVATYKWCRSRYEGELTVSVVFCILSSVDAINIII